MTAGRPGAFLSHEMQDMSPMDRLRDALADLALEIPFECDFSGVHRSARLDHEQFAEAGVENDDVLHGLASSFARGEGRRMSMPCRGFAAFAGATQ